MNIIIYTHVPEKNQQKMLRWLSRQNIEILYEVFKLQKNNFYRLKNQNTNEDVTLLSTAAFILAAEEVMKIILSKSAKSKHNDLSIIKSPLKLRGKQMAKKNKSDKYEKLLNLKEIVFSLREKEGMSYYRISDYLKKWHRFEISHAWIRKFYKDITEVKDV